MAKQKYYVVWNGRKNGVYDNWGECKKQVEGYSGAQFKSFKNQELANDAYKKGSNQFINSPDLEIIHPHGDSNSRDVPWN